MKIGDLSNPLKLSVIAALLGSSVLRAHAADSTDAASAAAAASAPSASTNGNVLPMVNVKSAAVEDPQGPGVGYVAKRSKTGSKTDSAVIDNPQSISTVTRQQMDDQGVQTVDQALRYTTGVYTQDGTDVRFDQLRARFRHGLVHGRPRAVSVAALRHAADRHLSDGSYRRAVRAVLGAVRAGQPGRHGQLREQAADRHTVSRGRSNHRQSQ
ncbi:exported hypothetical protein [Paraburkholderia tropica]